MLYHYPRTNYVMKQNIAHFMVLIVSFVKLSNTFLYQMYYIIVVFSFGLSYFQVTPYY